MNRFSQFIRSFRVVRLLLWTLWVIYRERQRVVKARERGNYEIQPNTDVLIEVLVAFRQTAIKLGVLMIKLGQFMSTRADLLPERALAVLTSLQDEVPPESFDHVVNAIESEYKKPVGELFSHIETDCAAAASLGQVHKAVLAKTGETVAVKIQRPNIDQLVAMDLNSLRFVIWVITKFVDTRFIDLRGFYREFRRTVYEEIDFVTEATNARRFKEMFKDDPTIYIPTIYEEYITRRVLVIEWIDGVKLNDYAALDAAKIDRLQVANRTVNAYFYQFFEAGFFHADPHPGNIFVKAGSSPEAPVIAFLDFGMVGSITKGMKRSIRDIFLGFIMRDAHMIVQALSRLGFIGEGANPVAIEKAITLFMEQYHGATLAQMRDLDMGEIAQDMVNLLYDQPFHIPAQFAFTGRAVSTLVGVSTGLAPDFNFLEIATPYARSFLGLDANSARETMQEVLTQLLENGKVLMNLPRSVENLITRLDSGQVEVKLANLPQTKTRRGRNGSISVQIAGSGSRISLLFMFLASMGGGIYLTNIHMEAPGWFCLGLAALTALGTLFRR
ncbi:ABC1 kinase family protein [Dictyobacter vulcani]|uniref:ABC1 kinase family protein n=1 Tax=Dictyobacter vulcani TaxID=2607529 RepID=UPI001386FCBA|nr:AarF/UbiB family protein [Dictyobacter vulcani]